MSDLPSYVTVSKGRTLLDVFVQPGAAKDAIVGVHGPALKVKIKAPPVDGRANRGVESFLEKALGTGRGSASVVAGASSRHKRVAIQAPPTDVARAIVLVLSSRGHEPGQEAAEG